MVGTSSYVVGVAWKPEDVKAGCNGEVQGDSRICLLFFFHHLDPTPSAVLGLDNGDFALVCSRATSKTTTYSTEAFICFSIAARASLKAV